MMVQKGVERALSEHKGLARGVNTRNGRITYDAVAKAVGGGMIEQSIVDPNVIPEDDGAERGRGYNAVRGERVGFSLELRGDAGAAADPQRDDRQAFLLGKVTSERFAETFADTIEIAGIHRIAGLHLHVGGVTADRVDR